ncbi:hypothetical protein ABEF95_004579 [Exophiala dermatitidis]
MVSEAASPMTGYDEVRFRPVFPSQHGPQSKGPRSWWQRDTEEPPPEREKAPPTFPSRLRKPELSQSFLLRPASADSPGSASGILPGPATREPTAQSPSESSTRESSPHAGRAGVYNPECDLADLSNPPAAQDQDAALPGTPSTQSNAHQHVADPFTRQETRRRLLWMKKNPRISMPATLSEHHRKYLEEEGAFLQLPRTTTDALLPVYITMLNDLIPIVDGERVFRDYSNGRASNYLVNAICLATCKAKLALPFLQLVDDGPVLKPQEFAARLLRGLDAALKSGLETDRIVKIQILALMQLNNDGPAGAERASNYLSQAVSQAWASYLHLTVSGIAEEMDRWFLWWSLRNLDRLNKPVMGSSPFMIDDADVSTERTPPVQGSYRANVMNVSLLLGDLLASATRLYKASYKIRVDSQEHFPSMSELLAETDFEQFHSLHKAYLEIWYHVAAMLSCRYSGPESFQYERRLDSACRTLQIISEGYERIPPLPLVPYAISMATAVIYRALRDGKRDYASAYGDLKRCYKTLCALSHIWTSARGVTKLTRRLLRRLSCSGDSNTPSYISHERAGDRSSNAVSSTALPQKGPTTVRQPDDASDTTVRNDFEMDPFLLSLDTDQVWRDDYDTTDASGSLSQLYEPWMDTPMSYPQFDMAFNDFFDNGPLIC